MTKTLSDVKQVAVAEIVRHGEKLTLPETMGYDDAIDLLQRRKEFENQKTEFSETYDVFPLDGAHALDAVLIAKLGWAPAVATPGWFGDEPPQMLSVEVKPGVFKSVAWGRFKLPNITGYIQTGVSMKNNRASFTLHASVLRRDEPVVRGLFNALRDYLVTGSIYKGQAIKLRFLDEDGDVLKMPEPKFIDTSKIDPDSLIYSKHVMDQVNTNLFTPILRVHDCIANGIKVKRGVLLAGTYGTGKTMAATVASKHAVDTGVTYLYIPRAAELPHAIEFAKQYQSPACVIFVEDIDRALDGKRDVAMDDILNLIDGIDTKHSNIIVVLTTNAVDNIDPAMLRAGRLDSVIEVTPPDAEAVQRLIRAYAAGTVSADEDLSEVGEVLEGAIPATIAEVVNRAKLAQLAQQAPGTKVTHLTGAALAVAARSMAGHLDLLERRIKACEAQPASLEDKLHELVATTVADVLGGHKLASHEFVDTGARVRPVKAA